MAASKATVEGVLQDMAARFVLNSPEEGRDDDVSVMFNVEVAHWHYVDHERKADPSLPGLPKLRDFAKQLFRASGPLRQHLARADEMYDNFMQYKALVPVFGAILLNPALTKCVLVRGRSARSSWGFPRGKINQGEGEVACAVREVEEETGYRIDAAVVDENNHIAHDFNDYRVKLFIVPGVDEGFAFQPQTRCEIKDVQWFEIGKLPSGKGADVKSNQFFLVTPFVGRLRGWLRNNKHIAQEQQESEVAVPRVLTKPPASDPWLQFSFDKPALMVPISQALEQIEQRTSASAKLP